MDPVLESYFAAEQNGRARNLASLQAEQGAVGMLGHLQDQQAKGDQLRREAAWRGQLRPDMSPDELIKLGMTSGAIGPKDVVSLTQNAQLKRESDAAKKQIAMDRLNATTQQKAETIAIGWKNAKTAEEKSMWQQEHARLGDMWSQARVKIQAGDSEWMTGNHYSIPSLPTSGPMAAPAAQAAPPAMPQAMPGAPPGAPPAAPGAPAAPAIMAGISELNAAEPAARAAGLDMQRREALPGNGGMIPTASVIPPRPVLGGVEDSNSRNVAGGGMTMPPPAAPPQAAPVPLAANTPMPGPAPNALTPSTPIPVPVEQPTTGKGKEAVRVAAAIAAAKGGGALFTPQALTFTAKQYLAGDRQAIQGFARNAAARIALSNEIVEEATRQGMKPEGVAAKLAEYQGLVAGERTVGQKSANVHMAAGEAAEMIQIVRETAAKFDGANFVPWNRAIKAYDSNTGEPEIKELGAALNSFVNVYARAIAPTGVPHQSDKDHARKVLSDVDSPSQINGVLNILSRELEIAQRAPRNTRDALRREITGESRPSGGGAPKASATVSNWGSGG